MEAKWHQYVVPKVFVASDWRVDILSLAARLGVFVYIMGYVLYWEEGYLQHTDLVGVVTASRVNRNWDISGVNPERISYCLQNPNHTYLPSLPCAVWDGHAAVFPVVPSVVSLSTRVNEYRQEYTCDQQFPDRCRYPWSARLDPINYYVAAVDSMELELRVSCTSTAADLRIANASNYFWCGELLNTDGDVIKTLKPGEWDVLTIDNLRKASGFVMSAPAYIDPTKPNRYKGGILVVQYRFSDRPVSSKCKANAMHYQITVEHLKESDYVTKQIYNQTSTGRHIRERYGLLIPLGASGTTTSVSLQLVLIHLVSSLGLLKGIAFVIELFLLSCHKQRKLFKAHKYGMTEPDSAATCTKHHVLPGEPDTSLGELDSSLQN